MAHWSTALAVSVVLAAGAGRCHAQRPPPNVVIIVSQGHTPEMMGPQVTPNLERLAEGGVRFTRAYCNAPLHRPSRNALLAGRLPHSLGTTLKFHSIPEEQITFAHALLFHDTVPYATAAIGNLRFDRAERLAAAGQSIHGFEKFVFISNLMEEFLLGPRQWDPPKVPAEIALQSPLRAMRDPPRVWLNAANLPVGIYLDRMPQTVFARESVEFMRQNLSRPFCLFVSFHQPRGPFEYPVNFEFTPLRIEPPEPGPEDVVPLIYSELTTQEKRGIIAAYQTAVAYMDFCAGIVLDGIRDLGIERDTLVIYLSTHGFSLGHHGWFDRNTLSEPVARVPLIVRWPRSVPGGRVRDELVELIDLFPTIVEATGADPAPGVEGRSLLGLLTGLGEPPAPRAVFSEYLQNEEAMVRDERYKLIYGTGRRRREDGLITGHDPPRSTVRLYDLERDPGEMHNLAADPARAATIESLKRQMIARFRSHNSQSAVVPETLSLDDQLAVFLVPRESWSNLRLVSGW